MNTPDYKKNHISLAFMEGNNVMNLMAAEDLENGSRNNGAIHSERNEQGDTIGRSLSFSKIYSPPVYKAKVSRWSNLFHFLSP